MISKIKREFHVDVGLQNYRFHSELVVVNALKLSNLQKMSSNQPILCDFRGDYLVVRGDHFKYRYEVIDMLGRGSFG